MIVKNVEKKENNKATFQVEVDSAAFEAAVNKAYLKNKDSIYIAGFRKGKAPRAIIEGMYGPDVFYKDAIDLLGPDAFSYGIDETKFEIVGNPTFDDVNFGDDKVLTFTFTVELYPEATLGQYKGLELEREVPEVTDEQLDEQLETVRKRNARMVPVEREARMGDTANIDFDGYLNGERFDGGKAEGYSLELGSNSFVPGFEDQVVGMKIGEEKDLNVTFPENYTESLAGKEVVFKVKLNALTEAQYPELDDDFAKDVSEFDTIAEYKEDTKKQMLDAAKAQSESRYRNDLMKMAADNMTAEIPQVMIEDKVTELVRNYAQNFGVQANDIPREKLVEMLGIDDEAMNNAIRPAAETQVRVDVMLSAVVKAEDIQISDEEADEYIAKIAADYGGKPEDLIRFFGRDYIVAEYKKEKAGDIIFNSAKDVKGKKPADDETKADETEKKPAKKTAKKADEGEEAEKKPAKKTAKKAAEGEDDEKKPTKKTAKKAEDKAE